MPSNMELVRVLTHCTSLLLLFDLRINSAGSVHMLSKSQTWTLDAGQTVHLECEFIADQFNLFDNPIVWRKRQQRPVTYPTPPPTTPAIPDETSTPPAHEESFRVHPHDKLASPAVDQNSPEVDVATMMTSSITTRDVGDDEETQINMMGNLIEPFASAKRFKATFLSQQSQSFLFGLTISNISMVDVGSYTCEVGGPQNTLLASVSHRLFVRANVDYVIITDDENMTSDSARSFDVTPDRHKPTLVFVEGQRGTLRCIAVGGQPTPVISVQMATGSGLSSPSTAPVIRSIDMPQSVSVSVHGRRGLRLVRQINEKISSTFKTSTYDDGAEVKCFAMITGLPPRVATSRIAVHYSAVIKCTDSMAGVGDRNVFVRCEVRAKPEVVHLRWIIDDNGTTVTEGEVINEYWTLVMDRTDGVLEVQLFMRQARPNNFRTYTMIAENGIAIKRQTVSLINKDTQPTLQSDARMKAGGYSFHIDEITPVENVSSIRDHVTICDTRTILCLMAVFVNCVARAR